MYQNIVFVFIYINLLLQTYFCVIYAYVPKYNVRFVVKQNMRFLFEKKKKNCCSPLLSAETIRKRNSYWSEKNTKKQNENLADTDNY